MSIPGSGLPRITPLQRISTKQLMPAIIVTSPGLQDSSCLRMRIQHRMKGAAQAATRSQSNTAKTSHPLALLFGPVPDDSITEFGLSPVEYQGRTKDPRRASDAAMPTSSAGETCDGSR